jgi:hypothetical protein
LNTQSLAALPPSFQALLDQFAYLFRPESFRNFVTILVGWVLARGRHTISHALQALGPDALDKHFSSAYAFFSKGSWSLDAVGEELFRLLVPHLGPNLTAIVDDTLCRKSGPHIWGAGMHHDAVGSTYGRFGAAARHVAMAFGHNFVVLAVWVPLPWRQGTGVAIPVLFRLYRQKKRTPESQYRKRTELARELFEILYEWNLYHETGKRLLVLGDGEYSSKTVLLDLPEGVDFVGSLMMKAALFERPPARKKGRKGARRKKGPRLPSPRQLAENDSIPWTWATVRIYGKRVRLKVKSMVCLWYTTRKEKPVRVVVTRDPSGRLEDRAFFTTDPRMPIQTVLMYFSRRWRLEVTFHDAKQFLGLEDPQNGWWRRSAGSRAPRKKAGPNPKGERGRKAAERTVPAIFLTYALVNLWYLDHGRPAEEAERARARAPWYLEKRLPSFADMLGALRWEILDGRIQADPHLICIGQKLESLFGGLVRGA